MLTNRDLCERFVNLISGGSCLWKSHIEIVGLTGTWNVELPCASFLKFTREVRVVVVATNTKLFGARTRDIYEIEAMGPPVILAR